MGSEDDRKVVDQVCRVVDRLVQFLSGVREQDEGWLVASTLCANLLPFLRIDSAQYESDLGVAEFADYAGFRGRLEVLMVVAEKCGLSGLKGELRQIHQEVVRLESEQCLRLASFLMGVDLEDLVEQEESQ